ncbi:hypothetical protein [Tessaracoccus sp. Z1128]
MASIAAVRRDPSGAPSCSVTFLLSRTPAPHEAIADLVVTATLAVELHCELEDLAWVEFSLDGAEPVRAESRGPFGTAALATTLTGDEARSLLTALAGRGGGPDLVIRARRTDDLAGQWRRPVAELITPLMAENPDRIVHLVTAEGGTVRDVFPARSTARTRGPGRELLTLRRNEAVPLMQAIRPQAAVIRPLLAESLVLATPLAPQETGPVLDGRPLLADRQGDNRWYLPEILLDVPSPGQDPDSSPFRFDLVQVGHQADGSPALEATVVVTLLARPSAATLAPWESAGRPTLKPVPCVPQIGLHLPFRDDHGAARTELVTANSVQVTGVLGEDGSRITATFVLQNNWARLAYGALSTPGFQAEPAVVEVGLAHSGWRTERTQSMLTVDRLTAPKIMALRRGDDATRPIAATQLLAMAKAQIRLTPAIALEKFDLTQLGVVKHVKVSATATTRLPALLACADHPQLYRQRGGDGWEAVGCRPALRLGETQYRPWQPEPVSTAGVRVFRSLTQPGRFLVIPENYAVGRYPADDPERAYEPTLLLTSTIDVENPANIRCVLAAALEPEPDAADFSLLAGELRQRLGRPVELVGPWQAGVAPEISWAVPGSDRVDCVLIDTGFTFMLTTDIPGLLTLRTLLRRGGLVGSARYAIPGGDSAVSTLRLDLSRVVGPAGGPVTAERIGDEVRLANRLDRRVSVNRVVADGAVVASPSLLLAPGQEATVSLSPGTTGELALDHSVEPGMESLDETRSYIEDLHLGVTFVATGDLAQMAGLEIEATFLGAAADPITLTRTQRQAERQFVLPLTTYATDPAVIFTVTAVASDGTRTAAPPVDWPVRTRGVLVPIPTPVPQP